MERIFLTMNFKNVTRIIFYGGFLVFISIRGIEAFSNRGDYNGFDVSDSLIPVEQIHQGGPPRDGIPAIDTPRFVAADKADNIQPGSRILGISYNGRAKAYPVSILSWHEIVNDQFEGQHISITYCPLCGTGMAFLTENPQSFGVSGLLYNSDMLCTTGKANHSGRKF